MSEPMISAMLDATGNQVIDILATPWVSPIYKRIAGVRSVIESPFQHGKLQFKARLMLAKQLRVESYTQAIVLPNSLKSALIPWMAKIRIRKGYLGEYRYGLLNNILPNPSKNKVKQVLQYYRLIHSSASDDTVLFPELLVSQKRKLDSVYLRLFKEKSPIVFCPGAEFSWTKQWPKEYFSKLAIELGSESNPIYLMGSPKEKELGEWIEQNSQKTSVNLCGKTSLEEAIDLLEKARLIICNDSGLMHVACALKRKVIALYGSTSEKFAPPLGEAHKVRSLFVPLNCRPCSQKTCAPGHFKCMHDLNVAKVSRSAKHLLSN